MMTIGSLFSGIGGLELGLERAGIGRVVWQAEIDPWCRGVLAAHWPDAMQFDDVRAVRAGVAPHADVLCGGFPCQDVSLAGRRAGLKGARSGLWSEYARIIDEIKPKIVVVENVLGLRTAGLCRVLSDLTSLGFDAEWTDFAAADLGAPHLRRRLFIAATHPERVIVRQQPGWLSRACRQAASEHRLDPKIRIDPHADGMWRLEQARCVAIERGWSQHARWELDHSARMDDGVPEGLDLGRARKALGNAVTVPCAELIGRTIVRAIGQEAP